MMGQAIAQAREQLRGSMNEIIDVQVPRSAMQKQGEDGTWYLSISMEVLGGVVELRLYGPSRASLTRIRSRASTQRALLGAIMQETYSETYRKVFVNLHMTFAISATHVLKIHKRRREFKVQDNTIYWRLLPPPANGVIELQVL